MEIDGEQEVVQNKRKVEPEGEDSVTHFFEHFTVPTDVWLVIQRFEEHGLIYRHLDSNRLLLIIRHLNETTGHTVRYDLHFRQADDLEAIPVFRLPIEETEAEDDKTGKVLYHLALLDEQYCTEPVANQDAPRHYEEFLSILALRARQEAEAHHAKRRKAW